MWHYYEVLFSRSTENITYTQHAIIDHEKTYMCAHISFADIVWVFIHVSGQAEVTDFHNVILRKKNVPSCQIPVNALTEAGKCCTVTYTPTVYAHKSRVAFEIYLSRGEELHSLGHLKAVADKILHSQLIPV